MEWKAYFSFIYIFFSSYFIYLCTWIYSFAVVCIDLFVLILRASFSWRIRMMKKIVLSIYIFYFYLQLLDCVFLCDLWSLMAVCMCSFEMFLITSNMKQQLNPLRIMSNCNTIVRAAKRQSTMPVSLIIIV